MHLLSVIGTTAWWQVATDIVAGVLGAGVLLFFLYAAFDSIRSRRRFRGMSAVPPPEPDVLAFPYYVDEQGLRGLAGDLRVELPVGREVTRSRGLSAMLRGVGADRRTTEAAQFAGSINLNRLVDSILSSAPADKVSVTVAMLPPTGETGAMEHAVRLIEGEVGSREDASEVSEVLERLRRLYETEQQTSVARRKQEELREVAGSNRLIIMSGDFLKRGSDGHVRLGLARLEAYDPYLGRPGFGLADPTELYFLRVAESSRAEQLWLPGATSARDASSHYGVNIEVVLPDEQAFTSAGAERINRGHPFFGKVIAHSPSFEEQTSTLMCSAYAVWGLTRPTYPSGWSGHA